MSIVQCSVLSITRSVFDFYCDLTAMSESKISSRKRSNIWLHFTPELNGGKARCDICRVLLSFTGGTTSNLAKHLRAKHPSVVDNIQPKRASANDSSTSTPTTSSNTAKEHLGESSTANQQLTTNDKDNTACIKPVKKERQNTLGTYIVKPASVARQKRLNELLLKMIVLDFQPFSIVTDTGFREFVTALDPSYRIPSRNMITTELLPAAYNNAKDRVKDMLADAEAVTLTTDSWTSLTTESYVAVTCHFITSDLKM